MSGMFFADAVKEQTDDTAREHGSCEQCTRFHGPCIAVYQPIKKFLLLPQYYK